MSESLPEAASALHRTVTRLLAGPVVSLDPSALEPLTVALEAQGQAQAVVKAAVRQAREAGASWQEIGDVLGVTRQAAFQRYGRPLDPRTGEAMTTAPLAAAAELAGTVVDRLARGRWDEVVAMFDTRMAAGLTVEGLGAAWAHVVALAGTYEGRGETTSVRAADFTVTETPVTFEAGEAVARISFRDDGSIAGLFLLPDERRDPAAIR